MPNAAWSRENAEKIIALLEECYADGFPPRGKGFSNNAEVEAARRLGVSDSTIRTRLRASRDRYSMVPDESKWRQPEAAPAEAKAAPSPAKADALRAFLKNGARRLDDIAKHLGGDLGVALDALDALAKQGFNIRRQGDLVEIPRVVEPSWTQGAALEIVSTPDNKFLFGATGDWHVGSKYFRDDVLDDLYRRYAEAGVEHVFHTGNWIDGEAPFNMYDLEVHGIDAQCRALADAMPRYDGMVTHAVWGDDHEGWYSQRNGMNVGGYCEQVMREAAREDWHDLGFMEAHVILKNANSGESAVMNVMHPGGGSAYALSYRPQKIIEAFEGGTKPAITLLGHYHKLESGNVRNVWYQQTGTTQDQTPFMRKKSIEAHVGGALIAAEQDPKTGAIISFSPNMTRYFNRGYYAGQQWSHHGPAGRAPRSAGGV